MTDAWMDGLIEAYNLQKYEEERKENGRKQGPLGTITVAKKGSKSSSEAAGRASKAVGGGVLNVSGGPSVLRVRLGELERPCRS